MPTMQGSVDFGLRIKTATEYSSLVKSINTSVTEINDKLAELGNNSGTAFANLKSKVESANAELQKTVGYLETIGRGFQNFGTLSQIGATASAVTGAPGTTPTAAASNTLFRRQFGWASRGTQLGPDAPWALQEYGSIRGGAKTIFSSLNKNPTLVGLDRNLGTLQTFYNRAVSLHGNTPQDGMTGDAKVFLEHDIPALISDIQNVMRRVTQVRGNTTSGRDGTTSFTQGLNTLRAEIGLLKKQFSSDQLGTTSELHQSLYKELGELSSQVSQRTSRKYQAQLASAGVDLQGLNQSTVLSTGDLRKRLSTFGNNITNFRGKQPGVIAGMLQQEYDTLNSSFQKIGGSLSPEDRNYFASSLERKRQLMQHAFIPDVTASPVSKVSKDLMLGSGAVIPAQRWTNPQSPQTFLKRIRRVQDSLGGVGRGEVSGDSLLSYLSNIESEFGAVSGSLSPVVVGDVRYNLDKYRQKIQERMKQKVAPVTGSQIGPHSPWVSPFSAAGIRTRLEGFGQRYGNLGSTENPQTLREYLSGVETAIQKGSDLQMFSPNERAKLLSRTQKYATKVDNWKAPSPNEVKPTEEPKKTADGVDRLFGSVTRLSGAMLGVHALAASFRMATQRVLEMDSAVARVRATVSRVASGAQKADMVKNIVGGAMSDSLSYGLDFTTASQFHTAATIGTRGDMAGKASLGRTMSALAFTTPTMAQDYIGMLAPLTNAGYTVSDINQFFKASSVMQAQSQFSPERVRAFMSSYAANAPGLGMLADKDTLEALAWHEAAASRDMVMGSKLNRIQIGLANPRNLMRLRDILSRGGKRSSIGGMDLDQVLNNGNPMFTLDTISQAYKGGNINEQELRAVAQTVDMWSSAPTMNLFKTGLDEWRTKVKDANAVARAGLLNPDTAARDQAESLQASSSRITQSLTAMLSGGIEPLSKGMKTAADVAQLLAGNQGFMYLLTAVKLAGAALLAWAAGVGIQKAVSGISNWTSLRSAMSSSAGGWGLASGVAITAGSYAYDSYKDRQESRVAKSREEAAKNLPFVQRRLESAGDIASTIQQVESLQKSGQMNEERRLSITTQLATITNSRLEAERLIQEALSGQTEEIRKQIAERNNDQTHGTKGWLAAGMIAQAGSYTDFGLRSEQTMKKLSGSTDPKSQQMFKMLWETSQLGPEVMQATGPGSEDLHSAYQAAVMFADRSNTSKTTDASRQHAINQAFAYYVQNNPNLSRRLLDVGVHLEESNSKIAEAFSALDVRHSQAGYRLGIASLSTSLLGDNGKLSSFGSRNPRRILGSSMEDVLFHGAEQNDVISSITSMSKNASPELAKALKQYFTNLNNIIVQELVKEILNPENVELRKAFTQTTGFDNIHTVVSPSGKVSLTTDDPTRLGEQAATFGKGMFGNPTTMKAWYATPQLKSAAQKISDLAGVQAALANLPATNQPAKVRDGIPKPINWMAAAQRIIGTADRATGAGNMSGMLGAMDRFKGGMNEDGTAGFTLDQRYKKTIESLNRSYSAEIATTTDPNMKANLQDAYLAAIDQFKQQYQHLKVASSPVELQKRIRTTFGNALKAGFTTGGLYDVMGKDKHGNKVVLNTIDTTRASGRGTDDIALDVYDEMSSMIEGEDNPALSSIIAGVQKIRESQELSKEMDLQLSTGARAYANIGGRFDLAAYEGFKKEALKTKHKADSDERKNRKDINTKVLKTFTSAYDANSAVTEFEGSTKLLGGTELAQRQQQRTVVDSQYRIANELLHLLESQKAPLEDQLQAAQKVAALGKQRAELDEAVIRAEKAAAAGDEFSKSVTSTLFDFSKSGTTGRTKNLAGIFQSMSSRGLAENANRMLDSLGNNPLTKFGSFLFDPQGTLGASSAQNRLTSATQDLTVVMRDLVNRMYADAGQAYIDSTYADPSQPVGSLVTEDGTVSAAPMGGNIAAASGNPFAALMRRVTGGGGGRSSTADRLLAVGALGGGVAVGATGIEGAATEEEKKKKLEEQTEQRKLARQSPKDYLKYSNAFSSDFFAWDKDPSKRGAAWVAEGDERQLTTTGKWGVGASVAMGGVQAASSWYSNKGNGRAAQNYSALASLAGSGAGVAAMMGAGPVGWGLLAVSVVASMMSSQAAAEHQADEQTKAYEKQEMNFKRLIAIQDESKKSLGLAAERIVSMRGDVGNIFSGIAASSFYSGRWAANAATITVSNLVVQANNPAELSNALTSAITSQVRRGIV